VPCARLIWHYRQLLSKYAIVSTDSDVDYSITDPCSGCAILTFLID